MARYVQIAMGSGSELQNHLTLARDLGFMSDSDYGSLTSSLTGVRQMLTAFLQTIRRSRKLAEPDSVPVLAKSEERIANSEIVASGAAL